jgi:hypothetical protein
MKVCDRCGKPMNENPCSAIVFPKLYVTVQKTLFYNKQCDLCKECERAIADFVFGKREEPEKE